MTWESAAGAQWQEGETEGLWVYCCNTCGGEIVADETTGATHCPYCDNPVVLAGHFAGLLKPDLLIHLGDYYDDGQTIAFENAHIPFYQVPGNCDRFRIFDSVPEILCYDIFYKKEKENTTRRGG